MGDFDISFLTSSLNNVSGTKSVIGQTTDDDVKVFNAGVSNPISESSVYGDEAYTEMLAMAGVEPTEAPEAAAIVTTFAAVDVAGINLVELDETFENEPDVVAHTLSAFADGSAFRIERQNQSVATLIENLPEGTTPEEFEAFMYAFNVA